MASKNLLVYQSGNLVLQNPTRESGSAGLNMEIYGNLRVHGNVLVNDDTIGIDRGISFNVADAYTIFNYGETGAGVVSNDTGNRAGIIVDRGMYSLIDDTENPGNLIVQTLGEDGSYDPNGAAIFRDDPRSLSVIDTDGNPAPAGPYPITPPTMWVWDEIQSAWDFNSPLTREDFDGNPLPSDGTPTTLPFNPRILNVGLPSSDTDETAAVNVEYLWSTMGTIVEDVINRLSNEYLNAGTFTVTPNADNFDITRTLSADLAAIDESDNIPIMYWVDDGAPDDPSTDPVGSWGGHWEYKPFEIFDDTHPMLGGSLDTNDKVIFNSAAGGNVTTEVTVDNNVVFNMVSGAFVVNATGGVATVRTGDAQSMTIQSGTGDFAIKSAGSTSTFDINVAENNTIIKTDASSRLQIEELIFPKTAGTAVNQVLATNGNGEYNELLITDMPTLISETVSIDDLTDVTITNPLEHDNLLFDSTTSQWRNYPFAIVVDKTPTLGGALDTDSKEIFNSAVNGNVTITASGNGGVVVNLDDAGVGALEIHKSGAGIIQTALNEDLSFFSGSGFFDLESSLLTSDNGMGIGVLSSSVNIGTKVPGHDLILTTAVADGETVPTGNVIINQMTYPSTTAPGSNYVMVTEATGTIFELKLVTDVLGEIVFLDDLGDVTLAGISDEQVLMFDTPTGQWTNRTIPLEHGNQGGGNEHTTATIFESGFMSSIDKTIFDNIPSDYSAIDHRHANATPTVGGTVDGGDGFMSREDKELLDGLISGNAEENQNAFSIFAVSGQSNVVADAKTDTVTFVAGNGVDITTTAGTDVITFAHTDTSSQANVTNSGGSVIQGMTFDTFGHTTGVTTYNLDNRYFTETESDARYIRSFQVEDGDSTEVTINQANEWKFVEGGSTIDINWTDTTSGTDGDPYDLTFTVLQSPKLTTARTISLSGDVSGAVAFDGTSDVNIVATVANNSHTHDDRYIRSFEVRDKDAVPLTFDQGKVWQIESADDSISAVWNGFIGTGADPYNMSLVTLHSPRLTTPRTFSLNGDATGSVVFDGTANAPMTVTVVNDSHTHDGRYFTETESDARYIRSFQVEDGDGTEVTINQANEWKFVEGGATINIDWTDTSNGTDGDPYDLTFTVLQSPKLTTARTIALTGDVSGSVAFDGTSNVSIVTTVANDSHTHDTRYIRSFTLRDGDSTDVVVDQGKFVRYQEGGSTIDINWTDTTSGTTADPYDLTFTVLQSPKWTTARTLTTTLTGDVSGTANILVDGTSNQTTTITTTVADNSHNHTTLNNVTALSFNSSTVGSDGADIEFLGTDNAGFLRISTYDDNGSEYIQFGDYDTSSTTSTFTEWLKMSRGTAAFTGNVSATSFTGPMTGNASTASAWQTARTTTFNGDVSGSVVLKGDGNTTCTLAVANDSHTHDGRYFTESESDGRYIRSFQVEDGDGTEVTINQANEWKFVEGGSTIDINWTDTSNGTDGDPYDLTFTVLQSPKLTTARTFTLTGDVSGSVSFDGTSDVSFVAVVANDSHTHDGRYYTESEANSRYAYRSYTMTAGDGLSGGGTLAASRSFAVDSTVARTNTTATQAFNGEVSATSFNTTSALKYKEDVDYSFKDALDKVLSIDVISYVSKSDPTKKTRLGVSAESIAAVVPELVSFKDGEPDSVNYAQITALLIQAMKEQEENKLINKMKRLFKKVTTYLGL